MALLLGSVIALTICTGCSKKQSNDDVALWQAMVMQAEQMRRDELREDINNLSRLLQAGDQEMFQQEREKICTKWSRVEKLSPVPVNINYTPEYMPIPVDLPCNSETLAMFLRSH